MNSSNDIKSHLTQLIRKHLPVLDENNYAARLNQLFEVGRTDLTLAKIAEAHWDALAILAEAKKQVDEKAIYAVWASEIPDKPLNIEKNNDNEYLLTGTKMFCSGAGIVDKALITAGEFLIDLNVTSNPTIEVTNENWYTLAFKETKTSTVHFNQTPFHHGDIIGFSNWYTTRKGFWPGALGPAACWGGGAAGLVDYAMRSNRSDAHTMAHLAAMNSNIWTMGSILRTAGDSIDASCSPNTVTEMQILALQSRHIIEQLCTDTLRRFARAYGPFPLACDASISRRYQELDLFLRQNHAERDLDILGRLLRN